MSHQYGQIGANIMRNSKASKRVLNVNVIARLRGRVSDRVRRITGTVPLETNVSIGGVGGNSRSGVSPEIRYE